MVTGAAAATPDTGAADPMAGADWLDAAAGTTPLPTDDGSVTHLWSQITSGGPQVQGWINDGLTWTVEHFRPFFQGVRMPIDATLNGVTDALLAVPWPALLVVMALVAWQFAGRALAIGTAVSLLLVAMLGIWPDAMVTLALVLTSLLSGEELLWLNDYHTRTREMLMPLIRTEEEAKTWLLRATEPLERVNLG